MNKLKFEIPNTGIRYISELKDYDLPRGHVIVDKGVTGCGYTEYCLNNDHPVVLCSPRKLLLENKLEQHLVKGDENLIYLKNEIENIDGINSFDSRVNSHLFKCKEENLVPKFLITYDSTKYIINSLGDRVKDFYFIVDEFQSIFLDSFFKSEVEFDFVDYLQDCPNVLYLSATPMLDKYLEKIDEFKDLPFYELDWSNTNVVENIILQRKFTTSLSKECEKIIEKYLNNKFPSEYTSKGEIVFSKEAVFYFNSVSSIIRVIKNKNLKPEQVNIICANDKNNRSKLNNLSRDLGINPRSGKGFKVGRVPLQGEPNKMFTFCTKTAYIGADFYSDCASSYIFADPNIKSLALDISLDLPQIVGRQRNRSNPFKNSFTIYYRTIRKSEMQSPELFRQEQDRRREATKKLLDIYDKISETEQKAYIQKLRDSIELSNYKNDFVSISKKTGKPVYNHFIELSNERGWEVSQKEYQDKVVITKSLDDISVGNTYNNFLKDEIQEFLDTKFNRTNLFREKMKLFCEFLDNHSDNKDILLELLSSRISNPDYRKYYSLYGTSGCNALEYRKQDLEEGLIDTSKKIDNSLSLAIYHNFTVGDRISKKEIKIRLQNIYNSLGITSKAKATDLDTFFKLIRTKITMPDKKLENGFKLGSL